MKSKEKRTTIRVLVLIAVLVALILIISLTDFNIPGMENQKNDQWFASNNCTCIARNRLTCSYGFELNNSFCVNATEKTYTNPLLSCSLYNCSDVLYQFNNKTGVWRTKN